MKINLATDIIYGLKTAALWAPHKRTWVGGNFEAEVSRKEILAAVFIVYGIILTIIASTACKSRYCVKPVNPN